MSDRTQMLRKNTQVKSKVTSTFQSLDELETGHVPEIIFRPGTKICLERARLVTESYRATEGEPTVTRKAKALAHLLDNMTIYILDGEFIVGGEALSYPGDPKGSADNVINCRCVVMYHTV